MICKTAGSDSPPMQTTTIVAIREARACACMLSSESDVAGHTPVRAPWSPCPIRLPHERRSESSYTPRVWCSNVPPKRPSTDQNSNRPKQKPLRSKARNRQRCVTLVYVGGLALTGPIGPAVLACGGVGWVHCSPFRPSSLLL